jgi:four helix bundle protein
VPSAQDQVPSRRRPATTFEDLVVWQRSKELSLRVYRVTARGQLARDLGLRSQIQRAAVSVMSNIAEGFERNSRAEFARFLAIARGSAGEVRSQVYLAFELGYIGDDDYRALLGQCKEITRMIIALRKSLGA